MTFGDNQSIELSNHPSIVVTRTMNVDNFTYEVLFDLNFNVKTNVIKGKDDYEGMYVVGRGVVHDVVCQAKIVPILKDDDLTLKYTISYQIIGNANAIAKFKKIAYTYQGKTSTKVIDSDEIRFKLNGKSFGNATEHELSEIT